MISKMLALVLLVAGLGAAQAQPYAGNDTGGIIVWTPENERHAVEIAANHCAAYGKDAYITSVYRRYGHYIGFACDFPHPSITRQVAIRAKG